MNKPDQSMETTATQSSVYGLVYIGAINDANGNPRRGWIIGYGTGAARAMQGPARSKRTVSPRTRAATCRLSK